MPECPRLLPVSDGTHRCTMCTNPIPAGDPYDTIAEHEGTRWRACLDCCRRVEIGGPT